MRSGIRNSAPKASVQVRRQEWIAEGGPGLTPEADMNRVESRDMQPQGPLWQDPTRLPEASQQQTIRPPPDS